MSIKFRVKNLIDDDWIYKNPNNMVIKGNTLSIKSKFTDIDENVLFEGDIIRGNYKDLNNRDVYVYFKISYDNKQFIAINLFSYEKLSLEELIYTYDVEKVGEIY